MFAVERLGGYISRGVYSVSAPFRPFGGAVDIIVVQQQDGSFKSSPWYVKFGKFQGVLKTEEKVVNISVNGMEADFHMYLDHKGEAYFLKDVDEDGEDPIIFSSLSSGDETDEQSENGGIKKSKSCDFVANPPASGAQINVGSGQIVARKNSRRSQILGYMFGRKSTKKDSKESEGGDADVARASSLERAETAADLLEVKWSTNLPTGRPRRDKSLRLSASDKLAQETHRDLQVNNDDGQGTPLVHDSMDDNCDCSLLQEATGPCNGKIGICSGHSHESSECSNCAVLPDVPSVIPQNQDLEIATSDASLQYTQELLHKTSMGINRFNVGNANFDEREDTSPHLKLAEIVGGPGTQHNVKHASDETNGLLRSCFSEEERKTFVVYCQETEKSRVGFDVPDDPDVEMLNFSNEKCEEAVVDANFLCEESKLTSDLNSQPESGAYMAKENVDEGSLGDTASTLRELLKTGTVHGSKEISANADKESIIRGPVSSFDINLDNSDYVEAEILGVTNQENITEGVVEKDLEIETPDAFWNQSQKVGFCDSCASGISESGLEEPPSKAPGSRMQLMSNQVLGSIEEPDLQGSLNNFIHLVQGVETLVEGNKMNKLHSSDNVGDFEGLSTNNLPGGVSSSSRSPSEISEENHFLFSDINDFMAHEMQQKDSISPNPMETGKHLFVAQDVMWRSNNTIESSASSVTRIQECFSKAFEPQLEESNNAFNALCIPRRGNGLDKEIGLIIESLPNFDSHINNSEMSDIPKPLSLSPDLGCESMKLGVLRKGFSSSSMPNLTTDHQLLEECSTFEEFQFFEELENLLATAKVEISLCKHTLYKGMGPDAASQAFDAERVNVDRFLSLGRAFAKNDELIVRIGGHYYPWDAAEPIILGMVSRGQEQSLVPEGTTAVNRIVETQAVDSSTIVDPSPGSWRIWPFKTSRNMDSVKPAPDGAEVSEVKSVSESTSDVAEDKTELKVNVPKKKVKSFVATSKELASLNLKEGKNTITFVFSTAMLGKQQVDARIYLWKWNTRVVVSDVDGTITRSDVLGQFMPLVGKDWSQTGVAHLFSAIKENGYQLLFLSARAISQAYLTRQFLFNLNQDGKALPDGPVVISPDGLFPSLFREVIRRAPHEFKIACLKDIKELFPPDCNPFYAGFGNRDTDELSYRRVGIPIGKIFIINAKGEVTVNRRIDRKSYNSLHALVDAMFPATSSSEQEEFNSWNYWRMPFPEIRI